MPDKLHRQWDIYMDRDLDKDTHGLWETGSLWKNSQDMWFVQDIDGWEGIVKFNGKKAFCRGWMSRQGTGVLGKYGQLGRHGRKEDEIRGKGYHQWLGDSI